LLSKKCFFKLEREVLYLSPKEQAQFIQTTGIEERRIALEGITASDLCLASARRLLTQLACEPAAINLLVFVSQTPDYKIPCTATILQAFTISSISPAY